METIESLRRKIAVSEDLQEVVKTMKTIAAVSIRQYEKAVASLRQYSHTVELGMQIVMRSQREERAQPRPAPGRRLGAIIFGSELGMCGQFNELLVSYALDRCKNYKWQKRIAPLLPWEPGPSPAWKRRENRWSLTLPFPARSAASPPGSRNYC